jgi:hypothetical protein
VRGSGVGFRLTPVVPDAAGAGGDGFRLTPTVPGSFRDAEDLAGVAVWGRTEEDWVGKAVGGGGAIERFALGIEARGVTFGREGVEAAEERKRPSSSSMGIRGVVDLPLMSESGG